jgi:hypothetical protein
MFQAVKQQVQTILNFGIYFVYYKVVEARAV